MLLMGGSLMSARISYSIKKTYHLGHLCGPAYSGYYDELSPQGLNKFGPVRTGLWGTLPSFAIRKKGIFIPNRKAIEGTHIQHALPHNI
jgi:hypothetical protein